MAKLIVRGTKGESQVIELHPGLNRLGRSQTNHFQLNHPSVSATHCEIVLEDNRVFVRDCASTNGTFVGGRRTTEAELAAGQVLRLGDVELLVESTDVTIAIPVFKTPRPAPPVVLPDGSLICPRHPKARATHQCTHCREVLCDACVHWLRRRGGKLMKFCPLCSHACVPLGAEKPRKKSLLGHWRKTVKLPFLRRSGSKEPD
jgi:FHA domain